MTSFDPVAAKRTIVHGYAQLLARDNRKRAALDPAALAPLFDTDILWHAQAPTDDVQGLPALHRDVWQPLLAAVPDLERRDDLVLAGSYQDHDFVSASGHYLGTFTADWLGIPATGSPLYIRFGEFYRFEGGRVVEAYILWDLLEVMRQAGCYPLAPQFGIPGPTPGPASRDGVVLAPVDPAEGVESLRFTETMFAGLGSYDGKSLASMGMERYWHPDMMWYGPAGIGTTRGISGFQSFHQGPFLDSFPDRKGGNHKARFGERQYVCSTGWPSVRATHTGSGVLGLSPIGKPISMRVMDFWRRDGVLLAENWVFIDMIDLARQMGVDVMARMNVLLQGSRNRARNGGI